MKKLMTIGAALVFAAVFTGCPGGSNDLPTTSEPYTYSTTKGALVKADSYFTKTGDNTYRFVLSSVTTKYTGSAYGYGQANFLYTLLSGMDSVENADENNTEVTVLKERHLKVNFVSGGKNTRAGFIVYNDNEEYKAANVVDVMYSGDTGNYVGYNFYDAVTSTGIGFSSSDFVCLKAVDEYFSSTSRGFYYRGDHATGEDISPVCSAKNIVIPFSSMKWGLVVCPNYCSEVTVDNPIIIDFTIEEVE